MFKMPVLRRASIGATIGAALLFAASLTSPSVAHELADTPRASDGRQARCLALAIYFEARGESERGQRAVADVVLARVRSPGWPKTICGVVYQGANHRGACQFSFACDGRAEHAHGEAWDTAKDIAAEELEAGGKPSGLRNATYFHATNVRPSWCKHMVRVARIGAHVFYRARG